MTIRQLTLILGIALACGPAGGEARPQERLLGVSRSAHELVEIDIASGSVIARIATGKGPHEIAMSTTGGIAYVPNLGTYPEPHIQPKEGPPSWRREPSGTVTRIDLKRRRAELWQLDRCRLPHGVEVAPNGRVIWVTCEDSASVQELDATSGRRLRTWTTGEAGVHELTLIDSRNLLAVANTSGGGVTFIDLRTGVLKTIPIGRATEGMAVSQDSERLYVLSAADARLCVVELEALEIDRCTDLDTKFSISVAVPHGREELWIAGNQSNEMLVLHERSLAPLARVGLGTQPLGISASDDGTRVHVTLPRRNEIVSIDTAQRREIRRYSGVMEGDGIAVSRGLR